MSERQKLLKELAAALGANLEVQEIQFLLGQTYLLTTFCKQVKTAYGLSKHPGCNDGDCQLHEERTTAGPDMSEWSKEVGP
jgi:hypothetical protein